MTKHPGRMKLWWTSSRVIGATASALCAVLMSVTLTALQARPHVVRFTTDDAFDAGTIAPYAGRHEEVYRHIDANLAEHLAQLQRWVRQPSVSAQNRGIAEMAKLLADDLRTLGFKDVAIVPTSGHPGVFGFYDAGAPRTLLVYMMYDVQPEEAGWKVPPFDGALVETELGRVLMARGATNQKGPERAFFNAVDSIIKSTGKLPVNLLVVAEGEEELGSTNIAEVIQKYEARLKRADGVFFPHNVQDGTGAVSLPLGFKGDLGIELEAIGGPHGGPTRAEIHSSMQAVVDSPAWRLTQALATLTTPDGNTILVPGYYDAIRPPTLEEQRLVNGWLKRNAGSEAAINKALGVERNIDGLSGRDLTARYLFSPTMNINGMWTGYIGEGMKTILPHVAHARLDSRLVPNQTPDRQLELIRKHLAAKGFSDITIRKFSGYPPAQTSVDTPIVQTAISVFNKYGATPGVTPVRGQRTVCRLYGSSRASDGSRRPRPRRRCACAERIHADRAARGLSYCGSRGRREVLRRLSLRVCRDALRCAAETRPDDFSERAFIDECAGMRQHLLMVAAR